MASPSMPLRSFINGKRVRPSPQHLYSLYDAATGTVREKVQSATPGQIRDGVIAASESQERWARDYSPSDRSKVLLRAARILERRAGEVALAETGDTGRTVRDPPRGSRRGGLPGVSGRSRAHRRRAARRSLRE